MGCANDNPKANLRKEIGKRLADLGEKEIRRRSALACGHLMERYPSPGMAMAYLAMPGEADPAGAIAMWRMRGVRVAAPRVNWADKTMEPALLGVDGGELVESRFGLREPGPGAPVVSIDEIGLVIVPALAYSRSGERLGRGGGFYDRFLARLSPGAVTVGLVLSCQVVDEVPAEAHDMSVGVVITEDGPV
ncbi:MAG: 5-formyltetrahydrofolate cyclo-ligase [Phycisphaerales bacterium]|nr:5-formyltetrahydrofolate cyclo-ligase [Phycisphaerales bacterium]MCB9835190.1 5-formyltetrahydrofolate cyclo-ligase [Phycisphaera sp.]